MLTTSLPYQFMSTGPGAKYERHNRATHSMARQSPLSGVRHYPAGPSAAHANQRSSFWISPREDFDLDEVVSELHSQVVDLAPSANFRHKVVGRHASSGTISKKIRRVAKQENASIVFLGSDNAGRLVSSISSVGANVGSDTAYDVLIVRDKSPARIAKLRTSSPHRKPKSDFYIPE